MILLAAALPLPARGRPGIEPARVDTALHVTAHAGLAGALVAAIDERYAFDAAVVLVAVGPSITYGIECLQAAIPGRGFAFADILADVTGSVVGVVAWLYVERR